MASVSIRYRDRKKGRVYEIVINRQSDGDRKREYRALPPGTTKAMANKLAQQMLMEIELGIYVGRTEMTFQQFAIKYLELYCRDLSPSTYYSYVGILTSETGLYSRFGNIPLQNISNEDVQKYINEIAVYKSPKTCRNVLNLMHIIYKKAILHKYVNIGNNPTENIVLPKKKKSNTQAYSLEQVQIMLERTKDDITLQTIIALGCLAGLRRGEMAALTLSCIVLTDEINEIRITENIVKYDRNVYRKETKTVNGVRNIPIPKTLVDILKRAINDYKLRKLKYGSEFKDTEGQLLCWEDGKFRDPQAVYMKFHDFICKQDNLDLPKYNLHSLRHSYASVMIDLGVSPKIMQECLGHANIYTTMNTYTHTFAKTKQLEVLKIDDALSKAN